MGLSAEDFRGKGQSGLPCGVRVLIESLNDHDRAVLTDALAAPPAEIQHAQIARVVAAEGHKVSQLSIARHRRGECRCGR